MNLDTEHVDASTALIRPHGRLTMLATRDLHAAVTAAVEAGHHHVVVDLSSTEFIDSSGLGALK